MAYQPMRNGKIKRKLGWLEAGLYVGGVALLAIFFQIRASGDQQKEDGIRAFRAILEQGLAEQAPGSGEAFNPDILAPNQDLWADQRIAEFEESLKIQGDPPLGIMTIDKLGIQVPVFNGTDEFNLNRGVGRIRGTAAIDAVGNLGIAGHRDGFFRGLKDIEVGDVIELQSTRDAVVYRVSSIVIVNPEDVSVLAPTPEKTLTLVTCYPFYYVGHAPRRYIVKATAEHLLAKT